MEIQGKTAIVTGASQGIGRSLAMALGSAGAQVAICARNEARLEEVAREIESQGGRVFSRSCDISDRDACEGFVDAVLGAFGRLDILINNAGALGPRSMVLDYPAHIFEEVVKTNIVGTFSLTQIALPHLLKSEPGVVLNLSSGLGRFGVREVSAYCASKFAIEGFSQSLADEYPGESLISMAVAPGMVATDMLKAFLDQDDVSSYLDPERVGEGFVELLKLADAGWTGRSLDIEEFLTPEPINPRP